MIVFQRWTDNFEAEDWSQVEANTFNVAPRLNAILDEANAKGKDVFVMVALVDPPPLEELEGEAEPEGEPEEEPAE